MTYATPIDAPDADPKRFKQLTFLSRLLETGSTQLIRNTAAQQLADIQKKHPDELFNLLTRVVPYLKAKVWETRIAAAKAVGGIVDNADIFDPNADDEPIKAELNGIKKEESPVISEIDDSLNNLFIQPSDDQLQLSTLDVSAILSNGKSLVGSAGREYEYFLGSMEPAERLAFQKKTLTSRLGLGGEYTEEELINETDVKDLPPPTVKSPSALPHINTSVDRKQSIQSALDSSTTPMNANMPAQTPTDEPGGLSKRQLNMLKRKSRKDFKNQANKVHIVDLSQKRSSLQDSNTVSQPVAIKEEANENDGTTNGDANDYFSLDRKAGDDDSKLVAEFKGPAAPGKSELQPETDEEGIEWPFERLCEYLMVDMFDQSWEVRHGACMGLREVIRVHGDAAGRLRGKSRQENEALNRNWLGDLACRVCCVLMLDRFGDYVSDNVVAPIRETAGQVLGSLLRFMSSHSVRAIYSILRILVIQEDFGMQKRIWQACHGGMIGMRYLVAIRHDVLLDNKDIMDGVLSIVMRGLGDWDDDVRSVSAATLIPVSDEFVKIRPSALGDLVSIVWDCLSNLSDDLSASTGSVMDLLAKLCSFPEVLDVMKSNAMKDPEQSFASLVPRLFPFLRHTLTGVRLAALRALLTFLNVKGEGTQDWIQGKTLRLVFQNILVERDESVLKLSSQVWTSLIEAAAQQNPEKLATDLNPHLTPMFTAALHPMGVPRHGIPTDPSLFIRPSGQVFTLPYRPPADSPTAANEPPAKKRRKSTKEKDTVQPQTNPHNIDGPMIQGDIDLVGVDVMIRSKIHASVGLGKLLSLWPDSGDTTFFEGTLLGGLQSPHSTTRLWAAMIAEECAKVGSATHILSKLASSLHSLVEEEAPANYADLISYLRIVQSQCHALVHKLGSSGHIRPDSLPTVAPKCQGEPDAGPYAFSLKDADRIMNKDFEKLKKNMTASQRLVALQSLNEAKSDVESAMKEAYEVKDQRDIRVRATAAAALVAMNDVPKKANLTIRGLMDSTKLEENVELQERSAAGVVGLIKHLASNQRMAVVEKLVGNLVKFYCMDTAETPEFQVNASFEDSILSLKKDEDIRDHVDQAQHERDAKAARVQRRGAKEALEMLATAYGKDLFDKVPRMKMLIESPLHRAFSGDLPKDISNQDNSLGQEAVDGMSTLRALVGKLHDDLQSFAIDIMPYIATALKSRLSVLRYAAAKCLATICSVVPVQGFTMLVQQVVPSINNAHDVFQRQGTIECIYHLIHVMGDAILPYVIFLIVPVLGRMSDSDNDIRLIATTAFATLVKLVPLEAGIPDPPGLSEDLLEGRERERKFIAQMLDPKKVEDFHIPVAIKAELRSYQQDGVNWLAFLNKYHLHGVLCDDMGLGKTLQTLCMVASDHHLRAEEFSKTQNPDVRRLPSLIVCPPTLSGHWLQEIRTYAPFLKPFAYVGPPSDRFRRKNDIDSADIVITSYEVCRNDVGVLAPRNWNYCVLDEGHLIKNPITKVTLAVKALKSNHRLILSGTPIQNNVLELWSLFDFLMPGFLGTEKVFKDRFAKPIAASRFSRSSSKEQEAGALAVEALHKQVLPFLLRRLKEEVLNDLPPKILQNYYCDLSDLQKKLFEDFTKKEGKSLAALAATGEKEAKQHIFTALNYMRKLCNSPALVMKESHKDYAATQTFLAQRRTHLRDAVHAPKLTALKDLLVDCGIGASDVAASSTDTRSTDEQSKQLNATTEAVSQHRALIFCQMKDMLDIVQEDVLKKMLPSVTYLRLDGSVEASKRQEIVNTFNGDPSIDCLLLTTSVGGLGLNLTGADTVIFVEHDWNPQKDIQAMDRAHRIGQKKVVNVHRLVTRGTLEEKILSLQRFKIDVASQVVSQQNANGLSGMDEGEILDLFNLNEGGEGEMERPKEGDVIKSVDEVTGEVKEKGKKGLLDDIGELWDERLYEEEFDMGGCWDSSKYVLRVVGPVGGGEGVEVVAPWHLD